MGLPVIWVSVLPGSTTAEVARYASQEVLALLREHGVEDVVVEWREAVVRNLLDTLDPDW